MSEGSPEITDAIPPGAKQITPAPVRCEVKALAAACTEKHIDIEPEFKHPVQTVAFDIEPYAVFKGQPMNQDEVLVCEITSVCRVGKTGWSHEPIGPEQVDLDKYGILGRWRPTDATYAADHWVPVEGNVQYFWEDHPTGRPPVLDESFQYLYRDNFIYQPSLRFHEGAGLRFNTPLASPEFGVVMVLVPGAGWGANPWAILASSDDESSSNWMVLSYARGSLLLESGDFNSVRLPTAAYGQLPMIVGLWAGSTQMVLWVVDRDGTKTASVEGPQIEGYYSYKLDLGMRGGSTSEWDAGDMDILDLALTDQRSTHDQLTQMMAELNSAYGVSW